MEEQALHEEVEFFPRGYPPPAPQPPDKSPDLLFNIRNFADVDNKARKAPKEFVHDYDKLVSYLTKGLTSDLAKVRSIFVWLSAQPVVNATFPKVPKPDTPEAWLKRIKYDRTYYTELFTELCRKAGVKCAIIRGASKGAGFEVGQKGPLKITNRWNAVHVQGSWQLVNVPWALISTDGLEEGDWVLVETPEGPVRQRDVATKKVEQELDEFWFLTKPSDFNPFCHAKDPRWQLLEKPWTDDEFRTTPRFSEDLFRSKWELITENKGVLNAKEGTCTIAYVHPTQNVKKVALMYNLYYNEAQSPKPLPEKLQLERYVLQDSKKGQKSLVTRLPQDGVYKLEVAGDMDGVITVLGEFRIECSKVKGEPIPFPEGCTEIGFTEEAENMGLEEPTQEEGIIQASGADRINFGFKFSKNKPQPKSVRATIHHNSVPSDHLSQYADVKRTNENVIVSVQVPKTTAKEYGVSVEVSNEETTQDNQTQEIFYPAVNYIVTNDKKLECPEQKAVMKVNNDVLESIRNMDAVRLRQLEASLKGKIDPVMRETINSFWKEFAKITVAKLQALVQAMNGSDIGELEKALAEYEKLGELANDNTRQARASLDLLRALKDDNHMQQLENALRTAYDVKLNRNSNIQKAEDTLVTYYEKELSEAYYKRTLEIINAAITLVSKSCVVDRVQGQFAFTKAKQLQDYLKEVKRVTDQIAKMKKKDLNKIAGAKGKEPHPHIQSVLMATFILLGEKEAELWNWSTIQNLLDRRGELGVSRAMADLDIDKLTMTQVDRAEGHVRQCQVDVIRAEDVNAALFLQWVQGVVVEKRGREAVKHRLTSPPAKNSNETDFYDTTKPSDPSRPFGKNT